MSRGSAFCEEHQRNIDIDEARRLYFAQPEDSRARFVFRCGDPLCRRMLRPLVAGVLYDQHEDLNDKKRSAYYRADKRHPHVKTCTWVGEEDTSVKVLSEEPVPEIDGVSEELGLIFNPSSARTVKGAASAVPVDDGSDEERDVHTNRAGKLRPPSSKFMEMVASRYLNYSDEQRKSRELEIKGYAVGSFYTLCLPIRFFSPYVQEKRIYRGLATVSELSNVYLVKFGSWISPEGKKDERTTRAEVKLTKRWIEENDRALGDVLHDLALRKVRAHCFIYSTTRPVEKDNNTVYLEVADPAHFALIPEDEVAPADTDSLAEQG
jgi:hypothetical protein